MRKILTILVLQVIILQNVTGQNIVQVEYFVNNDPGFGLGTQLAVTPALTQDIEFQIDVDGIGLSEGSHILTLRAKDEFNQWSILESRVFFVNTNTGPDVFPPEANIEVLEYFIDSDPGLGLGTQLSVTPAVNQDIEFQIDVDGEGLLEGIHILTLRAKDEFNQWGILESRVFYVNANTGPDIFPPAANIDVLEYFVDTDPGFGNGEPVPGFVAGMLESDITFDIASIALPEGIHNLVFRAMDELGNWSIYETRVFHVINNSGAETFLPSDIIEVEVYVDNDPGTGMATTVSGVTQSLTIDVTELILAPAGEGKHVITVRAKNINNEWSVYETRPFWVKSGTGMPDSDPGAVQVTKLEYYFNDPDPGLGVSTDYPITPAIIVDLTADPGIDFPTPPDIPVGTNQLTVRAQNANGNWGLAETREFDVIDDCDQPVADFSFQLACAGEPVQFTDLSTIIQPDATYRWYLNGDAIVDNTTVGNVSFSYQNPGDYDVSLAIRQGQICYDSIGYQITIKPKPVALFTPSGFVEGSPTIFTVASSNVDPGAVWEWDFQNDATVDDNTAGNTTFTYPAAAIYTANLRVTDNLGCETSFSSAFTIQPAGGGGGGLPAIDFVVSSDCEGETTVFTDLSENIPPGAVYSWDFDNDGVEDDNSTGSTLYAYPVPGEYTSKLLIDLGGGTILNTSKLVKVTQVPVVDFSIQSACANEVVNFTDLSVNLETGATYKWDFENDGIVDDNTVGDNIHTYTNPGTYLVSLEINNGYGCKIKATRQLVIDPVPVAGFSYSSNCASTDILFTNTSQNITSGSVIEWDFENDGTVENTGSVSSSYQFSASGTYDVSLSITQPNGCSDTYIESIEIVEFAVPDFTFSKACISSEWSFEDLSQNVTPEAIYSWDFDGDGVEDSAAPGNQSFQFTSQGTYVARLSIDNGSGCKEVHEESIQVLADPVPNFTIVGGCVGDEIFILDKSTNVNANAIYSWDFNGDGIEDSQFEGDVSFIFDTPGDYTFNLLIDNGNGCTVLKSQDITLHGIPNPDFEVLSDCFGLPSRFVDLSTDISSEATYSWDFDGDGISDDNTVGNTTFTFTEFKPYIATLTIDNGLGCINVTEVIVDFRDAAAPDFVVGPSCIKVETVFTDQSSELETAAIYSWDFNGDGLEDSSVPGSTHYTYTRPGIYQASLTIFNAELCSSTKTVQVEVTMPPSVDLGEDVELCSEGTVTIDAGMGYTTYFWDDGSSDQTLTVDNFGEYWVSVTDVKGCRNIDTVQVRLKDLPQASFEYSVIYSPVDGIIVEFENTSLDADIWSWDFGDGLTSLEQSPSHIYSDFSFFEDTPYTVCLIATDRCDLVSNYCEEIFLDPLYVSEFGNESNNIHVYPNPAKSYINVEFGDLNILNLVIVDQKGSVVKRMDVVGSEGYMQVDLEGSPPGVYLVILTTEEKQIVSKVILEE